MSAQLFYLPFKPAFTSRGLPAGAASVYFYASGTSTLQAVFGDAGLTEQLDNPVLTDALGMLPTIYMPAASTYRVRVEDVLGAPIGNDVDPYVPGTLDGLRGSDADQTYIEAQVALAQNASSGATSAASASGVARDASQSSSASSLAYSQNAFTSSQSAASHDTSATAQAVAAGTYASAAQAFAAGALYTTVAAGVAAVAEGAPFLVQGAANGTSYAELYRKTSGAGVDQSLAIPSLAALTPLAAISARTTTLETRLLANTLLGGTIDATIGGTIGDVYANPASGNPGSGVNTGGVTGSLTRPIYAATEAGYGAQWRAMMGTAVSGRTVKFYVVRSNALVYASPAIPAANLGLLTYPVPYSLAQSLQAGDTIGLLVSGNTYGVQIYSYGSGPYPSAVTLINQTIADVNVGDSITGYSSTTNYFPLFDLQYVRPANVLATQAFVQSALQDLSGLTIALNGDSIASFGQGQPGDGGVTWPTRVAQITGINVLDHALGGTGACWDPANPTVGLSATQAELTAAGLQPAYSYEVQTLPFAGDAWIFAMGFNDNAHVIGALNTTRTATTNVNTFCASLDRTTIFGAYQFMIERRLQAYPGKVVILTTPTSLYAPAGTVAGLTNVDTVMRALAKFYALPLIDFSALGGISFATVGQYIASDGTHPLRDWQMNKAPPIAISAIRRALLPLKYVS